jgi:3'-5' exoribonuclease
LLGAFLHDLGKTEELDWSRGFSYTQDGELVGHIVRGAIMIEEKASEAELAGGSPLEPALLHHLQHLVLSHHERPEYGAAKQPQTPEAHVLCLIDRLDATLHLVD